MLEPYVRHLKTGGPRVLDEMAGASRGKPAELSGTNGNFRAKFSRWCAGGSSRAGYSHRARSTIGTLAFTVQEREDQDLDVANPDDAWNADGEQYNEEERVSDSADLEGFLVCFPEVSPLWLQVLRTKLCVSNQPEHLDVWALKQTTSPEITSLFWVFSSPNGAPRQSNLKCTA